MLPEHFAKILPLIKQLLEQQNWPAGALYMVATPIGNIADISLRALYILQQADIIACEDTRRSQLLLQKFAIKKTLLALHQHNEVQVAQQVVTKLQQGQRVVYISDAGTPAVSDPGAKLVQAVIKENLTVVPIPGASSITSLLSVAGIVEDSAVIFQGFLPVKGKERSEILAQLELENKAVVLLEAPHRIAQLAKEIEYLGSRRLTLGRELTKQFEQVVQLSAGQFSTWLKQDKFRLKGEYVLVIHPQAQTPNNTLAKQMLISLLPHIRTKLATQLVAQWSGINKNQIYKLALELKEEDN